MEPASSRAFTARAQRAASRFLGKAMRMRIPARDMSVHVAYLDLHLAIVAQGMAWSPDVADDMIGRMGKLFDQSMLTLAQYGTFEEDEDDDEFGPTPDRELVDPRIVFVEDDDNG
jgi:hypothetical protein